MSRLYFLTPDLDTTVNITHELYDLNLTKEEIHVAGPAWEQLKEQGVNVATLRHTTDVGNAAKRGVILGILLGFVLGLITHYFLDRAMGDVNFWLVTLGMTAFGGLFGVWSSTLVGVAVRDVKLDEYDEAIENGAFLMMVDVPEGREDEINAVIHRHHPEVVIDKASPKEKRFWGQGQ
ncbi:DUF1269 domain-containing protein [Halomonas korlensis]|uniref:DUF1269 domain-containing protein n=1 Tax=Halomonas korlensis TaxID=463301 RepID=A0A1I7EZM4_9GAMM|nr:DUF1269 domain-containing protein [Halomonas korlensis]SFU29341.1 hypothetical protein SAMN04487955_101125 [Halomonas korlensis]